MDNPTNIVWWVQNLGFPGGLLFLIWLGGNTVWKVIKPYVLVIMSKHVVLLDQATDALKVMPKIEHFETLHSGMQELILKTESNGNILVELRDVVKSSPPAVKSTIHSTHRPAASGG